MNIGVCTHAGSYVCLPDKGGGETLLISQLNKCLQSHLARTSILFMTSLWPLPCRNTRIQLLLCITLTTNSMYSDSRVVASAGTVVIKTVLGLVKLYLSRLSSNPIGIWIVKWYGTKSFKSNKLSQLTT